LQLSVTAFNQYVTTILAQKQGSREAVTMRTRAGRHAINHEVHCVATRPEQGSHSEQSSVWQVWYVSRCMSSGISTLSAGQAWAQ
jgi:hypothetical protein